MKAIKIFVLIALIGSTISCKKWLDKKPDKKLATPQTVADLQALMDNYFTMNVTPGCLKTPGDEYYILSTSFNSLPNPWDKDVYVWKPTTLLDNDWNNSYRQVFYANTVLDNIDGINVKDNGDAWKNVKGSALFYRAWNFYQLSQAFCKPYMEASASSDEGIPLRLNADFSIPTTRATVKQTYDQVIADLEAAADLLPDFPQYLTRPSKAAAYGLLGKVLLAKGDYMAAEAAANRSLAIYKLLVDFNDVNAGASVPFPTLNKEVIFYTYNFSAGPLTMSRGRIDSSLILSYQPEDLRKKVLFRDNGNGSYAFKGSYDGSTSSQTFSGIATDEVWLIKAEAAARNGKTDTALNALNTLLAARWKTGTFTPYTAASPAEALKLVLEERKKELIYRGTRWPDIRRLNRDGAGIRLSRIIDGQVFELAPNDKRSVFLIPEKVIQLSGIAQNEQ